MAFDVARAKTVMFGGYASPITFNETWEYNGVTWLKRSPPASPPARYHASMAYDVVRHVTVLLGGTTNSGALDDMWTWDGTTWTAVTTALPTPRSWAGLTWDAARSKLVLFGGLRGTTPLNDTWEWDGVTWTLISAGMPPARQVYSLAYDTQRARTVFVGGYNAGGQTGTWEYDGATWAQQNASLTAPPPQWAGSLVFDAVSQRVLLIGGTPGTFSLSTTWVWDAPTWSPGPPLASASAYAGAAFDSARSVVVLFGGANGATVLDQTLEY